MIAPHLKNTVFYLGTSDTFMWSKNENYDLEEHPKDKELLIRAPMFRWHLDTEFLLENYGKFQLPDLYVTLGRPLAGTYNWQVLIDTMK